MLTIEQLDEAQGLLSKLTDALDDQQKAMTEMLNSIQEYADFLLAQIKEERDA